jgi:anti-sigma factor (TIGR02949 family)
MTQTRFGEQACGKVLARLDSYIDNELLTESSLDLMEHFQHCAACSREAQERQRVRTRLRAAVREVRVPPGLEGRVRDRLRQTREPRSKISHLMMIAAALTVCLGSWVAYQFGARHLSTASQESYIAAMSRQVAAMLRVGLGDHLQCAVIEQRADRSRGAVDNLPAKFKELIPIARQYVPGELPLILAHECRYHSRKFVHLTFGNDRNLLSLVIARKQDGESFGTAKLRSTLSASGIPMYTAGVKQFQVAAFESRDFLVYTVSDLPRQNNLALLTALSPALQTLLDQMTA